MIKEAEENAALDKSKKALVNINYELDNLISKIEKFYEKSSTDSGIASEYLKESLKELKQNYLQNKLLKISQTTLDDLKYAYSIIVLDYFKQQLNSKNMNKNSDEKGSGVVIDVTDQ